MTSSELTRALASLSDPSTAEHALRFFKTGPGEYGEGDRFRGIRVPVLRTLARQHQDIATTDVTSLLNSPFHEDRLLALLIMVRNYTRGDAREQADIFALFCDHTGQVNNWDLVDTSAPYISGPYLFARNRKPLYRWVKSKSLWERRIAIMSTFYLIRQNDFDDTLKLSALLLNDPEDLIHKAVGWMLREVGNKDRVTERLFLDQHAAAMPRTMLRYAVERFPESLRKQYMKKQR